MGAEGNVRHLDHFVVAVMDADRGEKFYTEVLGAKTLRRDVTPNMTRVFMKLGENHVGLFTQGKATLPKRDSADSYPRHSFLVPEAEYDSMVARIRKASSFVKDIQKENGLGCVWNEGLVFQDSEGNFLEIAKANGKTAAGLEQALVAANRELIARFEQKIQATLARVWGEEVPTLAAA